MDKVNGIITKFGTGGAHFTIPQDLRKDSKFPFKIGDHVEMCIDGEKMIITKEKLRK